MSGPSTDARGRLLRIAGLGLAAVIVFGFVLRPLRVSGASMWPTYGAGAVGFVDHLAYAWAAPARGDVVAVRLGRPGAVYARRVVGLPGETVAIEVGTVLIDGFPLVETHVAHRSPWTLAPVSLGPGDYFVIGDNRAMPMDQQVFGRAPRQRILGKLVF